MKEIMGKIFANLMKTYFSRSINPKQKKYKENKPIIIKFLEILIAEDLKSSQRQKPTVFRENQGEISADFLPGALQPKTVEGHL